MTIQNNRMSSPNNKIEKLFTELISLITDENPNIEKITEQSKKLLKYFENNRQVDTYDLDLINYYIKKIERIIFTSIDEDKVKLMDKVKLTNKVKLMNSIIIIINNYIYQCNSLYNLIHKLLIIKNIPKNLKDLKIPEIPIKPKKTSNLSYSDKKSASSSKSSSKSPSKSPVKSPPRLV
jgi:hypothetical protein